MGIRPDPRTGMIVQGSSRPLRTSSPIASPPKHQKVVQVMSMEQLRELAKEIGTIIAEQLKHLSIAPTVIVDHGAYTYAQPAKSSETFAFNIDESIIDVGIGEQEPLAKGQGSAKIAQDSTSQDNLKKAKQSLKALKVGR